MVLNQITAHIMAGQVIKVVVMGNTVTSMVLQYNVITLVARGRIIIISSPGKQQIGAGQGPGQLGGNRYRVNNNRTGQQGNNTVTTGQIIMASTDNKGRMVITRVTVTNR